MRRIYRTLAIAFLAFFLNYSTVFAAGSRRVELIASDQSSHVCKVGIYSGWNFLSGTNVFKEVIEFTADKYSTVCQQDDSNSISENKLEANWNNYNLGLQLGYTYFFNRSIGWNILDIKGGYNQFATFSFLQEGNENSNIFNYSGCSFDILTGVAFNLWEDGLDFEEGTQYGSRLVCNLNVGINLNLCKVDTKGEQSFTIVYPAINFSEASKLVRLVIEPSIEMTLTNGFYVRGAINVGYFGPWKAEKQLLSNDDFMMKSEQPIKTGDAFTVAPMASLGWDFSALINN